MHYVKTNLCRSFFKKLSYKCNSIWLLQFGAQKLKQNKQKKKMGLTHNLEQPPTTPCSNWMLTNKSASLGNKYNLPMSVLYFWRWRYTAHSECLWEWSYSMDFQSLRDQIKKWLAKLLLPVWTAAWIVELLTNMWRAEPTYRGSHIISLISGSQKKKKVSTFINISFIYSATMGYSSNILGVIRERHSTTGNPTNKLLSAVNTLKQLSLELTSAG